MTPRRAHRDRHRARRSASRCRAIGIAIPGLFEGALNAPGTLNLLGLCFVFGALALTYDLVFGYVGLLSFGHALYFATGVYVTAIALTRWHWGLPQALALTAVVSLVLPLALGAICLRMRDIPFAMVTLAFAQAGSILVDAEPVRPDRRRRRPRARRRHAAAVPRRRHQHAQPVLDRARRC